MLVWNGPTNSSLSGIEREPLELRTSSSAPAAMSTEPQSPWGSAWTSEPATVPRLRTIGSEMKGAASPMTP